MLGRPGSLKSVPEGPGILPLPKKGTRENRNYIPLTNRPILNSFVGVPSSRPLLPSLFRESSRESSDLGDVGREGSSVGNR